MSSISKSTVGGDELYLGIMVRGTSSYFAVVFSVFAALLNFLQEYFEEVRNKQTEFDKLSEQTQFLMQNSAESRVMTQLTQLNSRYTTLFTFVKVCWL